MIDIASSPERYGCLDFKVKVDQEAINHVRALYAPPDDPVFQLVPSAFNEFAATLYKSMGSPTVNWQTAWEVYNELLYRFQNLDEATACIEQWSIDVSEMDKGPEAFDAEAQAAYSLLQGKDLEGGHDVIHEDGSYYMGGVNNGRGLDSGHVAQLNKLDDDNNDDDFEPIEAIFSDEESIDSEGRDDW